MDIYKKVKMLEEENKRLKDLLKIQDCKTSEDTNNIEELIEIEDLEEIFSKFSKLTGYTTGFVKQDTREVLISTGWTDICKNYHRGSPSSEHICQESNAELTKNLKAYHQISMKQCLHGMVDGATPVIIDGKHLADIFSGQVLFHKPNLEDFKCRAKEFGYDIEGYLEALEKVKVTSEAKLREVLEFLAAIAKVIAKMGKDKKEYLKLNLLLEEKVKERMKEKESLLALFDKSDNVLFKWDNNCKLSVAFVSESVEKLLGYEKKAFETHQIDYTACIHPDDVNKVIDEIKEAKKEKKSFFSHEPYRVITKEGQIKWILDNTVIVRDEKGEISYYLGYLSDITQLKDYQEKLEVFSKTDPLTKIKNRLYLDEKLQQQYYRYLRNHEKCSIILIDIDYFKEVNDTYGHMVGDMVLIEFAKLLQSNIRKSDIVGRWGGEEFLIILPHSTKQQARVLAEKLRHLIEEYHFTKVGHKTASFGISELEETITIQELLDRADKALYLSKKCGRNQIHEI